MDCLQLMDWVRLKISLSSRLWDFEIYCFVASTAKNSYAFHY
jgi:hypothetical protein